MVLINIHNAYTTRVWKPRCDRADQPSHEYAEHEIAPSLSVAARSRHSNNTCTYTDSRERLFLPYPLRAEMLQYLLLLCAFSVPSIRALAIPAIEATAEDPKCLDITHCRTLSNIVWSCLVTIFACTWVSIHRNVVLDSQDGIDALLDRAGITALTILVPEFTLAWAVRQWIVARQIANNFNTIARELKQQRVLPSRTRDSAIEVPSAMQTIEMVSRHDTRTAAHEEELAQINRGKFVAALAELWNYLRSRFPNDDRDWTFTHGFFVLMGGFYYFHGNKAGHPVSREDLEDMIKGGLLVDLPNKQDIDARSKSDAFSKTVTVLQTLWFVMQCIARAIQHLPITNIEIATLAYTTITFAMHRFWLNKPLNVSLPVRLDQIAGPKFLPNKRPRAPVAVKAVHWREQIETFLKAAVGAQDDHADLSKLRQVPTLYAGNPNEVQILLANTIALAVGAIFGAVHCIAWSFAFPSQTEKLLWRISAVTTVVIPLFYVVFVVLYAFEYVWMIKWAITFSFIGMPLYLVARVVLLVLIFTTLRDLPPAAYEAIHWMSFIPHV